MIAQVDRPGDVRKIDPIGSAGWKVGPFDATRLSGPVDRPFATSDHLQEGTVIELGDLDRAVGIALIRAVKKLAPHQPSLRR